MVGDIKQSIYGFRNANPLIFKEKYDTYGDETSTIGRKIDLTLNFRSRGEVINNINELFSLIMFDSIGGAAYKDEHCMGHGKEKYDTNIDKNNNYDMDLLTYNYEGNDYTQTVYVSELIGEVLQVMRDLAQEGMTMLVVTHEMNFARNVASKVIFMENGQIVEQGKAKEFFEDGMVSACRQIYNYTRNDIPVTIYYAYKQSDPNEAEEGQASSGWETMLSAIIQSGLSITGTWPMRTEQAYRSVSMGTNALASSIILAASVLAV